MDELETLERPDLVAVVIEIVERDCGTLGSGDAGEAIAPRFANTGVGD